MPFVERAFFFSPCIQTMVKLLKHLLPGWSTWQRENILQKQMDRFELPARICLFFFSFINCQAPKKTFCSWSNSACWAAWRWCAPVMQRGPSVSPCVARLLSISTMFLVCFYMYILWQIWQYFAVLLEAAAVGGSKLQRRPAVGAGPSPWWCHTGPSSWRSPSEERERKKFTCK